MELSCVACRPPSIEGEGPSPQKPWSRTDDWFPSSFQAVGGNTWKMFARPGRRLRFFV
jgi:hypothetical protein